MIVIPESFIKDPGIILLLKLFFYAKNFDYPEKPLKYKHIRRISD